MQKRGSFQARILEVFVRFHELYKVFWTPYKKMTKINKFDKFERSRGI